MNSVTDKSLSESDIHNSGNVQAGFGNGVMEVGNKIQACDRGLELKAAIKSVKNEIGLQRGLCGRKYQKIED